MLVALNKKNIITLCTFLILSITLTTLKLNSTIIILSLCAITIGFLVTNYTNNFIIVIIFTLCTLALHLLSFDSLQKLLLNKSIVQIFGSFFLSILFYYSTLCKRIIFIILSTLKRNYYLITLSFMLISFVLSISMNNTTTTLLILSLLRSFLSEINNNKLLKTNLVIGVGFSSLIGGNILLISSPSTLYINNYLQDSLNYQINSFEYILLSLPFCLALVIILSVLLYLPIKNSFKSVSFKGLIDYFSTESRKRYQFIDFAFIIILVIFMWGINIKNNAHYFFISLAIASSIILYFHLKNFSQVKNAIINLPYTNLILIFAGLLISLLLKNSSILSGDNLNFLNQLPLILKLAMLLIVTLIATEFLLNSPAISIVLPLFVPSLIDSNLIFVAFLSALATNSSYVLPQSTPTLSILWKEDINKSSIIKYGLLIKTITLVLSLGYIAIYLLIN